MRFKLLVTCLLFHCISVYGQETSGNFLKDPKSGCTVWFKHYFQEDSVSWSGTCKNNFAQGKGTMQGFTNGTLTSKYVGEMQDGKPHGKGTFTFGNNRNLKGYFSQGEPLFLNKECLKHLQKIIISNTDSADNYVGDNNQKQLYYHALVPEGKITGALILMPGTWETTEHVISSNQILCELAYKNKLALLVPSINQRLTLDAQIVSLINAMFEDVFDRYSIPKNKMVIGGWSMGGLFALRYTEMAKSDSTQTAISPAAVFSCDGPCDLENIYRMFEMKLKKFPDNSEAAYGMEELKNYCGGTPDEVADQYRYFSCYSHALPDGGNARYLKNTPVRIYNDVDANWWMENRGLDMYSMNALDQTAMILNLNEAGNKQAEFINSYQKGVRIEGNRHPHSWSTVEPKECMQWILQIIK